MKILNNSIYIKIFIFKFIFLLFISNTNLSYSQNNKNNYQDYKSIKSGDANMRIGPGERFEILWNFKKPGLPLKILKKYEQWYKVETPDGSIGWMWTKLISHKEKTIILKENDKIYKNNNLSSIIIANVDKNSILKVHFCKNNWCKVESKKYKIIGFIRTINIWGAFVPSTN